MANKQISIIGFGSFGKLAARHLILAGADVSAADVSDKTEEADEIGARFVSLEEACKNRIIILAVPMESLEETLDKIKDKLAEGTLVLDVCSLKIFACEAMAEKLGKNIEIIGTHPLFGPQSAPNSIKGLKIALVNVRAKSETFEKVRKFCENLGLNTIITTAEEHDRQMAVSQALTHFVGRVLNKMDIKKVEMSTPTLDKFMSAVDVIKQDTPALFENMQTMNPFAKPLRDEFVKTAGELNKNLNMKKTRE